MTAELEFPLLIDETQEPAKDDVPEPDAGGGNDNQLPPKVVEDTAVTIDILTSNTSNPSNFLPLPKPAQIPQVGRIGFGTGNGAGTGTGNGMGADRGEGTGTGTLGGMQVPSVTVIIMDGSPSMTEYKRAIYAEHDKSFPDNAFITIRTCTMEEVGAAIDYAIANFGATSIYLLSDFKDEDPKGRNLADAAAPFIETMKQHGIKLFISTVAEPPYLPLDTYAQKTGGVRPFR